MDWNSLVPTPLLVSHIFWQVILVDSRTDLALECCCCDGESIQGPGELVIIIFGLNVKLLLDEAKNLFLFLGCNFCSSLFFTIPTYFVS
jgi:hypothetical protein